MKTPMSTLNPYDRCCGKNTENKKELLEYVRLETVYRERKWMYHQMTCVADVLEAETEISSTAKNLVHEIKQTVQDLYLIASDAYLEANANAIPEMQELNTMKKNIQKEG